MPDKTLDEAMQKGDSWAKKVGYGSQGVLLDDIPRMLAALGLKAVDASRICVTREQLDAYEAYKVIARTHLSPPGPALDQDWDKPA